MSIIGMGIDFYIFIVFVSGFIVGGSLMNTFIKLSIKNEKLKDFLDKQKQFKEVLKLLKEGKVKFKNRINDAVYFDVNLEDHGKVQFIYFLNKIDISIFKGDKCLYTSNDISEDIINDIVKNINIIHGDKINDIVEILGFVFSKEYFEKSFGINIDELREKSNQIIKENESDIKNIINNNNKKFDIDDILDKINSVGIQNLTKEELDYLNNYNK